MINDEHRADEKEFEIISAISGFKIDRFSQKIKRTYSFYTKVSAVISFKLELLSWLLIDPHRVFEAVVVFVVESTEDPAGLARRTVDPRSTFYVQTHTHFWYRRTHAV